MPPYPTLGEADKRAAGNYFTETLFGPRTRGSCASWRDCRSGKCVKCPPNGHHEGEAHDPTRALSLSARALVDWSAAHALGGANADVTVIDRRNYHLFQPLLYQVATAGLSPAQIASPIRAILRRAANVRVVLGRVSGIDKQRRMVKVDSLEIGYDYLVLATGSRHAYFGHDEWERVAPGLREDRRRHPESVVAS